MNVRTDVLSLALAAVDTVAIAVLAGLGQPIPPVLETIALVVIGGVAGASLPTTVTRARHVADPAAEDTAVVTSAGGVTSTFPRPGA